MSAELCSKVVDRIANDTYPQHVLAAAPDVLPGRRTDRRVGVGRRQVESIRFSGNLSFNSLTVLLSCFYKGERLWALALSLFIPALLVILAASFVLYQNNSLPGFQRPETVSGQVSPDVK